MNIGLVGEGEGERVGEGRREGGIKMIRCGKVEIKSVGEAGRGKAKKRICVDKRGVVPRFGGEEEEGFGFVVLWCY